MNVESVIIYQSGFSGRHGIFNLRELVPVKRGKFLLFLSKLFAVFGAFVLVGYYSTTIINTISQNLIVLGAPSDIQKSDNARIISDVKSKTYKPPFDSTLPEINTLSISSVNIETAIYEAMNEYREDALKKGVWRVSNFGDPDSQEMPTILVAHRFGYLNWGVDYRLKNSFYNLSKTKKGDIVEIVWMQRKYTYMIYEEKIANEIDDYSADLILYTCKSLNSPEKIFRYARLLRV